MKWDPTATIRTSGGLGDSITMVGELLGTKPTYEGICSEFSLLHFDRNQ